LLKHKRAKGSPPRKAPQIKKDGNYKLQGVVSEGRDEVDIDIGE
jgi:hypothetical protein